MRDRQVHESDHTGKAHRDAGHERGKDQEKDLGFLLVNTDGSSLLISEGKDIQFSVKKKDQNGPGQHTDKDHRRMRIPPSRKTSHLPEDQPLHVIFVQCTQHRHDGIHKQG